MKRTLHRLFFTGSLLLSIEQLSKAEQVMTHTSNQQGAIKLYVSTGCPYCDKVIAYLKSIGKLDQVTLCNISNPQNFSDLKKLSGGLQRPFLSDEQKNLLMLESDDIIKYFSTRF